MPAPSTADAAFPLKLAKRTGMARAASTATLWASVGALDNAADMCWVAKVNILDKYTGKTVHRNLQGGESFSRQWGLKGQSGWYDLVVTLANDPGYQQQFAGHVETGQPSMSDPAMGGLIAV